MTAPPKAADGPQPVVATTGASSGGGGGASSGGASDGRKLIALASLFAKGLRRPRILRARNPLLVGAARNGGRGRGRARAL